MIEEWENEFFDDGGDLEIELFSHIAHGINQERNISEVDLIEWGKCYFPHYINLAPSNQHRVVANEVKEMAIRRGRKIVVEGPRDSAKSVWCTFIFPLWSICEQTESYIQLYADVAEQAEKYLEAIRFELENNPRLAEDYPGAVGEGPRWNVRSVLTRNGVRLDALSTGKKIRGRRERQNRPSLIIGDDLENEEHIYSSLRRERNRSWFHKAVEKSGDRFTNFVLIGTRLHRECLIATLSRLPGWRHHIFKALESYPENMELWEKWKDVLCVPDDGDRESKALAFYDMNRKAMEEGARVLWPERESLYDLMGQWATDRVAFESEKMNNPFDPEACEFPPDYFDYRNFWFDDFPVRHSGRWMACDPSKGKDAKKGDYSAIIKLQAGNDGYWYVDCDMERRPSKAVCDDIVTHGIDFCPEEVGLETNQFQELLVDDIGDAAKERSVDLKIRKLENTINKELRIRRNGPYLSRRELRFRRSPGSQRCVDQLRDFPNGDHDDGPDALEMALRIAETSIGDVNQSPLSKNTEGWPNQ